MAYIAQAVALIYVIGGKCVYLYMRTISNRQHGHNFMLVTIHYHGCHIHMALCVTVYLYMRTISNRLVI